MIQQLYIIYPYSNIIEDLCGVDQHSVYSKQFSKDMINKLKGCFVNNLYNKISTMETLQGLKALQLMEEYKIKRDDAHKTKYHIVFDKLTDEIDSFHAQFKVTAIIIIK